MGYFPTKSVLNVNDIDKKAHEPLDFLSSFIWDQVKYP